MNMVKHEKNILRIFAIKSYPRFQTTATTKKNALRGVLLNLHPITTMKILIIKISPRAHSNSSQQRGEICFAAR